MTFFDLFDNKISEAFSMAKISMAEYGLIGAGVLFGLGLLGYVIIKIMIPEAVVTSWWRSAEKTKSVSGLDWDWHMLGLVYDIALPTGGVSTALFNKAKNIFPVVIVEKGNNIVSINQADHLHVGWINKRMGVQVG
jgi:hypothetical protein